jgi:nitroreductase
VNVKEAIWARRAHRAFTSRQVEEPVVRELLRAAVQAPSAVNAQPWRFAVVQDTAQLARWSAAAKALLLEEQRPHWELGELLQIDAFNIFYDARTLVVIGVDEPTEFSAADCWLAAGNLMLAATELGLGTCCIGFAIAALNTADARRELGFKPTATLFAPIIVGYPSDTPEPVPRREPQIVSWSR